MRRKALTVRGVTVSDSFSVREEGEKNLPSFRMEHLRAGSKNWAESPSRPSSCSPGEGEHRNGPTLCSPRLPFAPIAQGAQASPASGQGSTAGDDCIYTLGQGVLPFTLPSGPSLQSTQPHCSSLPIVCLPTSAFLSPIFQYVQCHRGKSHTWLKKLPVSCPGFAALTMRFFCLQQLLCREPFGCITSAADTCMTH